MTITEETTELESLIFAMYYGSMFAISLNCEYFDGLQSILTEPSDKYTANKIKEAYRNCNTVYKLIEKRLFNGMNEEQIAISKYALESHHQLAYSVFGLDSDEQQKVREFIKEMKS